MKFWLPIIVLLLCVSPRIMLAQQANVWSTQEGLEALGLSSDATELAEQSILAEGEAGTFLNAFTDNAKIMDISSNNVKSVIVDGVEYALTKGTTGSTNPAGVSITTPPSGGWVYQFEIKADGYLTLFSKFSSNKAYYVFEGDATTGMLCNYDSGMIVDLGEGEKIYEYSLPGDDELGYFSMDLPDADKYSDGANLRWPAKIFLSADAADVKKNGFGYISFPVYADAGTYLFCALGSKANTNGFIFTPEKPKQIVAVAPEKIDPETGAVTQEAKKWVFRGQVKVVEIPEFSVVGDRLSISCATEEAIIRYTLNGEDPTESSAMYTAPLTITDNRTIKARAFKDGYTPSGIATYTPTTFTCSDVSIAVSGTVLTLTTSTPGAAIHYTIDGTTPTAASPEYTGPVTLSHNCTIKAIAVKEYMNNSAVTTYTVDTFVAATPDFTLDGDKLTISSSTPGSTIYYTTDGSTPTDKSAKYTTLITLIENGTVKAIACAENFNPSAVATYNVDIFLATPTFSINGNQLSISCSSDGATIRYTLNGEDPTESSAVYTAPLTITDNRTIKARAFKVGCLPSGLATYTTSGAVCAGVQIQVIDNTVSLASATAGATIYYTVDGTNPTTASARYTQPFTVNHNCTIKAFAVKENMDNSSVTTYVVNTFTVATPTFTIGGDILTISCSTLGASIYYTTNGETPTDKSTEYTAPLTLNDNRTIKAIAYLKDYNTSRVASYTPTSYTCATVAIEVDGTVMTLSTTTQGATIYFTLDGTMPTKGSTVYSGPVTLATNCTIKAFAVKEYMNDSPMSQLTVSALKASKPTFALDGDMLTIKSSTPGSSIYYTIGGGDPNESSTLYTAPVKLSDNREVRAIAFADGLNTSDIASYWPNAFSASIPRFSLDGNMLSIICDTPEARIHYTIGGQNPTSSSERYTAPILLTDNSEIRAIAYADKLNESVVASYIPQSLPCCDVQISYDGHYVTMQTCTSSGTIYYTTNGTEPTTSSEKYTSTFDAGGAYLVKAVVKHEGMVDSKIVEFQIPAYFDGKTLTTTRENAVDRVFDWCNVDEVQDMIVVGEIGVSDLSVINKMSGLRTIDFSNAKINHNTIPDKAFAGMRILSITLPGNIQNVGENIFDGCEDLAAIVWNATAPLPANALAGISNGNLMLYVKMKSFAPVSVKNVIVNNIAESITISDDNRSFYCPQEFLAKQISYTHRYSLETGLNICAGWETLCLPFDVQTIHHEKRGAIAPFASEGSDVNRFWLYNLGKSGFASASGIIANTPYIISMPNNDVYGEEYILAGDVTFSASNTYIPMTTRNISTKDDIMFVPTTVYTPKSVDVYTLNVNDEYDGQPLGSIFIRDLRDVKPFESYLTFSNEQVNARHIKIADLDVLSSMPVIVHEKGYSVYSTGLTLFIESTVAQSIQVYSLNGSLVRILDVDAGTSKITDLTPGAYLVGKAKVVLK